MLLRAYSLVHGTCCINGLSNALGPVLVCVPPLMVFLNSVLHNVKAEA